MGERVAYGSQANLSASSPPRNETGYWHGKTQANGSKGA